MVSGKIDPEDFLTNSTAQGLRVTISSTIDLSSYLLKSCGYYVLTGRMSQDPLEVISNKTLYHTNILLFIILFFRNFLEL